MALPFLALRQELGALVAASAGAPDQANAVTRLLRVPDPARVDADLALPCFELARRLKTSPPAVASVAAGTLAADPRVAQATGTGPYANVRLRPEVLAGAVVPAARAPSYGHDGDGAGKTVVLDFSSPNIAKPLAFHHIRSTVIGAALARLHAARGWTVVAINYLGDWGKQFGLLATGFRRHGDPARRADAKHLVEVYVRANAEAESDPACDREARQYLKRLESGDGEALAEWREFRETSIADFMRVYARMGVEFTAIEGESFYTDRLDATIARVAERPGTRESEGALIVDLPYAEGEPPVLLKTRDGTTLYVTRDIAAAIDRHQRFGFERALYVIAQDQALHMSQLERTLAAMGLPFADRLIHVPFGRVHGMSTRRGTLVFLDEVLDEAVAKAREICAQSEALDPAHLDDTVEAVGVGAVVFGDLRNPRQSDYTFRMAEAIRFDGLTGPYVQFTHARLASILRKAADLPGEADLARLTLDEERRVLLALAQFPEAVTDACETFEPSLVTRQVLDIAQATSHYLTAGTQDRAKRILVDDEGVRAARLHLVDAVRATLAFGLRLLGVRAPDAM